MTRQLLRDHRNAKRRCFEKRPFSMALRMYEIEKWEKTPEAKETINIALFCIMVQEEQQTKKETAPEFLP